MVGPAVRRPLGAWRGRHPVLGSVLVVLVALLALVLLWHLVTMDHVYPGGMLGGCIVVLTTFLLILVPRWVLGVVPVSVPPSAWIPEREPLGAPPRPPPASPTLGMAVLLL